MCLAYFKTPKGFPKPYICLQTTPRGLSHLDFVDDKKESTMDALMQQALDALEHYFRGTLKTFNLPLDLKGTSFELAVWQALQNIAYGQTSTYSAIAQAIKHPRACRAVGNANHKNPCSLVIPCHRILCKNGSIGGYGGGVAIKAWLLSHEKKI